MRQVGGVDSQDGYYNPQLGVHRDIALSIDDNIVEDVQGVDMLQNILNNPRFRDELMRSYPNSREAAIDLLKRIISEFRSGNYSYLEPLERNESRPRRNSGGMRPQVAQRGGKRRRRKQSRRKSLRKRASRRKSRSRRR